MKMGVKLKLAGILAGLLMILGALLKWDVYNGGEQWRYFEFLGLDVYSSDSLVGLNLFPVFGGALFVLVVAVADKSIHLAVLAAIVSGLSFLLAAYNYIYLITRPQPRNSWVEIHAGLYLTLISSLAALILSILIARSLQGGRPKIKLSGRI